MEPLTLLPALYYVGAYCVMAWLVGLALHLTDSFDEPVRDTFAFLWILSLPILAITAAFIGFAWSYGFMGRYIPKRYNEWRCGMGDHKLGYMRTLFSCHSEEVEYLKQGYTKAQKCLNCRKDFYFK